MKLVVIGGGASGMFCAVNAARLNPGLSVLIAEKSNKLLSKVRISGGGRCNVTHGCFDVQEMQKKYPRGSNFVKKSFHQFFTNDTIEWFQARGIDIKQEEDGRMFPVTDSSESIISALLHDVNRYRVEIILHREVKTVQRKGDKWIISYASGELDECDYVCIACGGYPKTAMFEWITRLGHTISEPVPSLFTFNMPGHAITALMGVSVPDVNVRIAGSKLKSSGPLLITHWGMSGPAILKLSAWGARELHECNYDFSIIVNWLPSYNEQELREEFNRLRFDTATQFVSAKNYFGLPNRLWQFLVQQAGLKDDLRWADLPSEKQNKLVQMLSAYEAKVKGKTTYKEEFVTAGGIMLSEINASTMESKLHPNLFFAGEVMDVDGITGGFNFQHAWTSGWIAAKVIAERSRGVGSV